MALTTALRLMQLYGNGLNDDEDNQSLGELGGLNVNGGLPSNLPSTGLNDPPDYNPYARLQELYHPRTAISQQYADALSHVPVAQRPSAGRIIAAGITAGLLGLNNPKLGMEAGDRVGNAVNNRNFDEYNLRTNALAKGAAEEDRYNTNQRILATNTVNSENTAARNAETARKNKKTEDLNQQKIDISAARAKVYQFKAEHPDYKVVLPKGGNVTFFNPQDPTQTVETDLPTGTLSDEEAINLRSSDRINEIGARANEERTNIGARGEETRKNIETTGEQTRRNIQTPRPNTSTSNTNSPSAQLTQQRLNAAKLVQERPDLAAHIHVGTGGIITVDPEGTSVGGGLFSAGKKLTKQDRDLIVSRIQGGQAPVASHNTNDALKAKAKKLLEDNKKLVTDANIDYLIQKGLVK